MKPKHKQLKAKPRKVVVVKNASRNSIKTVVPKLTYDRPYFAVDKEDDLRF